MTFPDLILLECIYIAPFAKELLKNSLDVLRAKTYAAFINSLSVTCQLRWHMFHEITILYVML